MKIFKKGKNKIAIFTLGDIELTDNQLNIITQNLIDIMKNVKDVKRSLFEKTIQILNNNNSEFKRINPNDLFFDGVYKIKELTINVSNTNKNNKKILEARIHLPNLLKEKEIIFNTII